MRQVTHAALNFDKYFFPRITAFQHKGPFFVFRYDAFALKWLPW